MALVDPATLRKIIVDGDNEALVSAAEKTGAALARELRLTTSQVRGIFGTVRQIEMDWLQSNRAGTSSEEHADRERRAKRELLLLKPRIAYQAGRERGRRGVTELQDVLTPAIDLIENNPQRFKNFVDFFEAILAYHRANGGSNS